MSLRRICVLGTDSIINIVVLLTITIVLILDTVEYSISELNNMEMIDIIINLLIRIIHITYYRYGNDSLLIFLSVSYMSLFYLDTNPLETGGFDDKLYAVIYSYERRNLSSRFQAILKRKNCKKILKKYFLGTTWTVICSL